MYICMYIWICTVDGEFLEKPTMTNLVLNKQPHKRNWDELPTSIQLLSRMVYFKINETLQNYRWPSPTKKQIPSSKLTWQWGMILLKMYSLLKIGIFHCYVSLLACKKNITPKHLPKITRIPPPLFYRGDCTSPTSHFSEEKHYTITTLICMKFHLPKLDMIIPD